MSHLQMPIWTIQDASGVPRLGAKIKFFIGGTDTPLAVYSDRARTTSLGTSVTVDASGNYGPIYLSEDKIYKVKITDSADVVLYTFDDIVSPGASGTAITRTSRATCPLDYGAIGDGVADEWDEVQSAIDDATGDIDLAGKTYRCDQELLLKSGIRLYNGALVFSNSVDAFCLRASGTLATSTLLTANVSPGDSTCAVTSAAGLAKDDIVYVGSTDDWDLNAACDTGEILRIKSVVGLTITLVSKFNGEYLVASNAYLRKINVVKDIVIEDVRVSSAEVATQNGIKIEKATRISLRNVSVSGMDVNSFSFNAVLDVNVDACESRGTSCSEGFHVEDARDVFISNCLSEYATTAGFTVKGVSAVSRNVRISGCASEGSSYGCLFYEGTQNCSISGSSIAGGTYGVASFGVQNSIHGCSIKSVSQDGILIQSYRKYQTSTPGGGDPPSVADVTGDQIHDNTIELCGRQGISIAHLTLVGVPLGALSIKGNIIKGCDERGIIVELLHCTLSSLDISGNVLYECQSTGVYIHNATTSTITRATIEGNNIDCTSTTGDGVYIAGVDVGSISLLRVSDNLIRGYAIGVNTDNVTSISISDNTISPASASGSGVEMAFSTATATDQKQVDIRGNSIYNPGTYGVRVSIAAVDLETISISSNKISGTMSKGISLATTAGKQYEDVSIVDNDIRSGTANSDGIELLGNTTLYGDQSHLSANYVAVDRIGIRVENFTNTDISSCKVVSVSNGGMILVNCKASSVTGCNIDCNGGVGYDAIAMSNSHSGGGITKCEISGNMLVGSVALIYDVASSEILIAGNNIKMVSGSYSILFSVSGSVVISGICISGNKIYNDPSTASIWLYAATGSGIAGFLIGSNYVHSSDDGKPGILLTGAGTGTIIDGLISGNFVFNGSDGIMQSVITLTSVVAAANYIFGCTNPITGTFTYAPAIATGAAVAGDLPNLYTA